MTRPSAPKGVSPIAMFRFNVLSEVLLGLALGEVQVAVIDRTARRWHLGPNGQPVRVSKRSLYRWLQQYRLRGIDGLEDEARAPAELKTLDGALVQFLVDEKGKDPALSVPHLIELARAQGWIGEHDTLHRSTVHRALRRAGADLRRTKKGLVKLRFAKQHRCQLVLCDGKHFRAGPHRARRVALFFIDDATRYVSNVVVGTSESAELFLRGARDMLLGIGQVDAMYVDNGSGFIAGDAIGVLARLGVALVHGTERYPVGRGKVERFNRTAGADLLRFLEADDVDPDCGALELRIAHYLHQTYNVRPHGAHGGERSPVQAFLEDERALRPRTRDDLEPHFFLDRQRRVTNDNTVRLDGVTLELPVGHAGKRVTLRQSALDGDLVYLEHRDELVRLHPVNLAANAEVRRSGRAGLAEGRTKARAGVGAALTSANKSFAPITTDDGGFEGPPSKPCSED
jgi:putative transposase